MFIIIHLSKYKCRYLNIRILISEEACPETSYVAATFHPTIGQCAHQYLSSTATSSWELFPQGIRNSRRLTHSKGYHKIQPSQHSWVYQATKEMERLTTNLVSSSTELWTPTPNLSWILNIYPPNTRKHPLLCYTVPQAMPSLPVLFRVCKEENHPPRSIYEVPSHTRFIKFFKPHFHSHLNTYQSTNAYTTIYTIFGLRRTVRQQNELPRWVKTTP